MHVKAIVPETEGMTHPDPRRPLTVLAFASGGLQAIQDGIWAILLQGEMNTAQGENTAGFFHPINFFLNSKPLTYILFSF